MKSLVKESTYVLSFSWESSLYSRDFFRRATCTVLHVTFCSSQLVRCAMSRTVYIFLCSYFMVLQYSKNNSSLCHIVGMCFFLCCSRSKHKCLHFCGFGRNDSLGTKLGLLACVLFLKRQVLYFSIFFISLCRKNTHLVITFFVLALFSSSEGYEVCNQYSLFVVASVADFRCQFVGSMMGLLQGF